MSSMSDRKVILTALSAAFLFAAGFIFGQSTVSAKIPAFMDARKPEGVDTSVVWKVWHLIDEKFVPSSVSTSTEKLTKDEQIQKRVWGMAEGLAASLGDPYTIFLPPSENKVFQEDISGSFEGVGMEITIKDGVLTVVSPLKGTPAYKAGIKAGDKILKINGVSTEGINIQDAVKMIRGPKGTKVEFEILREDESDILKIEVVRDKINIPVVETKKLEKDKIFVIELMSFTANSPEKFKDALVDFINSGYNKLIIDLRGNPGGYLDAAVDIASWFLPKGAVVVTEDFAGKRPNIEHRSKGMNIFTDKLRLVVLVDKGSASASEILAGALKAHKRAKIIGTRSFGKGSVQELIDLDKGSALKITVARWILPDGSSIQGEGVKPDIEVELPKAKDYMCASKEEKEKMENTDYIMDKAIEYLRSVK